MISIGLVSEDGRATFYAERNDYRREAASDFVRDAVLPPLAVDPQAYEGVPTQQAPNYRDLCMGSDAHTHYFDLDNSVMLAELRTLI